MLNLSRTKNKYVLLVVKKEDISMIEMKHLNTSKFKSDWRINNISGSGHILLMICCDSFQVDFDSTNDLIVTQTDIDVIRSTCIIKSENRERCILELMDMYIALGIVPNTIK